MPAFECHGLWTLPSTDAQPVGGTLYVSAHGNLRLSVIGSLGPQKGFKATKEHPIILGSVDGPLGNNVTLANCFVTRSKVGSFDAVREEYHAQRGFFGAHLKAPSEFAFRRMQIRIGGLGAWAHSLSGFRQGGLGGSRAGEEAALLFYSTATPAAGQISGGLISLGFGLKTSSTLERHIFTEQPAVVMTFDSPVSDVEINQRFIFPLQNLMTFVSDRVQEVEEVSVWREDILAPRDQNPEIRLIGARVFPEGEEQEPKPIHPHELLFAFSDLEDGLASFIDRWFRLATIFSDACDVFFGLQYGPPAYLEMTFVGMIEALALFYTRRKDGIAHRNDEVQRLSSILGQLSSAEASWIRNLIGSRPFPAVVDILFKLVDEHWQSMKPLLGTDAQGFVNGVINTFNFARRRDPEFDLKANHGAELYWMTAKLRILLKLCLLRELGFSEEKSRSFLGKTRLYQHICYLLSSSPAE